jgi:hypothetical protein
MAEEGYGYCPICQAVMPNGHAGLNPEPVFKRIWDHTQTHSTWAIWKALRKIRKEEKKLRSKSS